MGGLDGLASLGSPCDGGDSGISSRPSSAGSGAILPGPAALEELTWALARPPYHARRPTPPPCCPCEGWRRVKGMGPSQAGRRELRSAPARPGAEVSEPQVPQPRPSPPAAAQRFPPLPDISGTASSEPGPVSEIPGMQLPWVTHWSSLAALGHPVGRVSGCLANSTGEGWERHVPWPGRPAISTPSPWEAWAITCWAVFEAVCKQECQLLHSPKSLKN